jgi:tetratricopeptide (TPR) repeat protein
MARRVAMFHHRRAMPSSRRRPSPRSCVAGRSRARVVVLALGIVLAPRWPATAGAPEPERLWSAGRLDPTAGLPGRWARELAERRAALARAGAGPAAVVPLLGLLPMLQGDVPNAELAALLDDVRGDRRRDPAVRAHASWLRARVHEADGRPAEALELYRATGFVLDWRIVGPFDNANGTGHGTAFAPELEPHAPGQSFVGKLPLEPLAWREHGASAASRAYVSFDELLWPNTRVTGYATTWVHSDTDRRALVEIGTGGPYKLWVGGTLVGENDVVRGAHPLQDAHVVRLTRGWNRILLKLGVEDGAWGFYLRLADPRGAPPTGLRISSDPPATADRSAPRPSTAPRSGVAAASVRGRLEAAARGEAPGAHRAALVEFYRAVGPFAEDDRTALDLAHAAEAAAPDAHNAWMVALLETDSNEGRSALERAIERARAAGDGPLLATLLLELSWRHRALGMELRARELLAQARVAAPDDALVELAAIDQLAEDGLGLSALEWLDDLVRRHPGSGTLQRDKAARLAGLGRTREALALLDALTAERHSDPTLLSQRIELALGLGDVDTAVALARTAASASNSPRAHAELARIEQAAGDYAAAAEALQRAVAIAPQDAELHARLGHALTRLGRRDAGVRAFQRSLELKPQQPELRDLLAALDARGGDDLFARYAVDLRRVARSTPTAAGWAGKDAGVLHHLLAARVLANGLGERLDHRIIRILDERGIESQARQALAYDPEESYVEVRRARVHRADGTLEEIGTTHVLPLAEAGYRMYYDQRQVVVKFPGLRVGDTLEVAFVRRDIAARNKFDEYFGDIVPLQGLEPRRRVEYVLEAPAGRTLHFNHRVSRRVSENGSIATYRFVREYVPAIEPETNMPGFSEVADYLHVSTYETWNDVARWYWDLVEGQLLADDEIRAGVREALAGLPADASLETKVAAIHHHVVRSTRYVGLEFGIHGYKPYKTTEVYDRRFGDCKDKASLLKVMLAEIGVQSHLVLVRTRDQGRMGERPASLAGFNHAIVWIPALDLWLDGTAEWSGPRELPANDQDASVLVILDGKGGEFRRVPSSAAADNAQVSTQTFRLDRHGNARADYQVRLVGVAAASWRVRFQSPDERTDQLTQVLGSSYPRARVTGAEFPGIEEIRRPVEVRARFEVPGFAQAQGDALRFFALGRPFSLAQRITGAIEREHDLVLPAASREQFEIRYELPAGLRFAQVPANRSAHQPVGNFSLEVSSQGTVATVRAEIEISRSRIGPAEYPQLRELLREVDAALAQTFEVREGK